MATGTMRASTFPFYQLLSAMLVLLSAACWPGMSAARGETNLAAELVPSGAAVPGETLELAIRFTPRTPEWHGYWSNPGDAGIGMQLDWQLPDGWKAGEPDYPVPRRLLIAGLMNHVYEGEYAVLVPITVPESAQPGLVQAISVNAQWLACTDQICVPEGGVLTADVKVAAKPGAAARQFAQWRAAVPPMLDAEGRFDRQGGTLRIAIPLAEAAVLSDPHVFLATEDLVRYSAAQTFRRQGDVLVAEIPLDGDPVLPDTVSGILAFADGEGVRFEAEVGIVPSSLPLFAAADSQVGDFWLVLLAALAGGLLLNILPCVFPILSLKALSLVRAGGSERTARREGAAYLAGTTAMTLGLGALLLVLRAGGEQAGWAFQLQEPAIIAALLVLMVAITANLAGLFHLPSLSFSRQTGASGAFGTGLLAAFVATPCTGPFMAAALGAALLLPNWQAMALFGMLGVGLGLPFLLIGFVPSLRRMLPKPGAWMETFRKLMAVPMALTAAALVWLCWRIGGAAFAGLAVALAFLLTLAMARASQRRMAGKHVLGGTVAPALVLSVAAIFVMSRVVAGGTTATEIESVLDTEPFSAAALAEARAGSRPVFVWMTADWCVTCKINESVAIERQATREAFEAANVTVLRGDWTRRDAEIGAYIAEQGAAGVPLYIWYDDGGPGRKLPQLLGQDALVELAEASAAR
ncbi:Protein-disulfide reductase [Alteripontixanthobacter maritimus]|uniref:Protein-disulfide reductase n=1 Tax=Alteripontixanthobacter maritimus TaxID=2161824 RepID=A0A369Q999_9SPHN|nr:protein-disulfide reductase DsbD domain-containing protein [Alteripontixanthobacter maritimus]RDC59489.1 Protein-disulfide reductase [Alteripontixanthobacter maritimus]